MDVFIQVAGSLGTLGLLFWQVKNLDTKVTKIRDNHLKHIADDISDIKVRVAVLENKE